MGLDWCYQHAFHLNSKHAPNPRWVLLKTASLHLTMKVAQGVPQHDHANANTATQPVKTNNLEQFLSPDRYLTPTFKQKQTWKWSKYEQLSKVA